MKKYGLVLLGGLLFVAGGVLIWMQASAVLSARAAAHPAPEPQAPPPKAVIEERTFNFGKLDPGSTGEHTFVIRNVGEGPLTLKTGMTSCKCTVSSVENGEIPPGSEGRVKLQWSTAEKHGPFSHGAKILTNDPLEPSISLVIKGQVLTHLAAEPPEIVFSELPERTTSETSVLLYSQVWREFSASDIKATHPGLTWRVEPAEPELLKSMEARSGCRLVVISPPGLEQGRFSASLYVRAEPQGEEAPSDPLEIHVQGTVLGPIGIYGTDIDNTGALEIGYLRVGQGARARLMIRVRDEHTDLQVESITTKPDFIRATVTPFAGAPGKKGLYNLEVEIPQDAPAGIYTGAPLGEIHVRTDHPRLPDIKIKVKFAILKSEF